MTTTYLMVRTAQHHYAVRRDDLLAIRLVEAATSPADRDQNLIKIDLGSVVEPADQSILLRRHGLFVPLRRKQIVLMVEWIDEIDAHYTAHPLPALLQQCLIQPWAVGALTVHDQVIVVLDLRALARSVLLAPPTSF